jgi:hypothetical protein
MPSSNYSEAMRTLLVVRRRLADQFAREVVKHSIALTTSTLAGNDPIGSIPELKSISLGLNRIQNAIAIFGWPAARGRRAPGRSPQPLAAAKALPTTHTPPSGGWTRFDGWSRTSNTRRRRASCRRAFTATRFFARALQNDASIYGEVTRMCGQIETMPPQQIMRTFVNAFGLQAVECGTAMMALRDRRRALEGGSAIAPTLAATLVAAAPLI